MTTLIWFAALMLAGPTIGQSLRWFDQHKARLAAELVRITAPLPVERVELTAPPKQREPWPVRQTPTDLAAAYQPIHWSDEVADTPADYAGWHRRTGEFETIVRREWPDGLRLRSAEYAEVGT